MVDVAASTAFFEVMPKNFQTIFGRQISNTKCGSGRVLMIFSGVCLNSAILV